MQDAVYTGIGLAVVWCVKYLIVPIGAGVAASLIAARLLQPQPKRRKKKRSQ